MRWPGRAVAPPRARLGRHRGGLRMEGFGFWFGGAGGVDDGLGDMVQEDPDRGRGGLAHDCLVERGARGARGRPVILQL